MNKDKKRCLFCKKTLVIQKKKICGSCHKKVLDTSSALLGVAGTIVSVLAFGNKKK